MVECHENFGSIFVNPPLPPPTSQTHAFTYPWTLPAARIDANYVLPLRSVADRVLLRAKLEVAVALLN